MALDAQIWDSPVFRENITALASTAIKSMVNCYIIRDYESWPIIHVSMQEIWDNNFNNYTWWYKLRDIFKAQSTNNNQAKAFYAKDIDAYFSCLPQKNSGYFKRAVIPKCLGINWVSLSV